MSFFVFGPRFRSSFTILLLCIVAPATIGQGQDPKSYVIQIVQNERRAGQVRPLELFTSDERSDRTSGHLWRERIAETKDGKLRRLISVDGQPLTPSQNDAEKSRLRSIAADPREFIAAEKTRKDEEQHAREMLDLLPDAYLFQRLPDDGTWMRFSFVPDPTYSPQTYEARVLHGMSGTLVVDKNSLRLHHLEGRLSADVSFGFGLLAVIHSGSSFSLTRNPLSSGVWKTAEINTDIQGRAVFFKTIARRQHTIRQDFAPLPADVSIPAAVAALLR